MEDLMIKLLIDTCSIKSIEGKKTLETAITVSNGGKFQLRCILRKSIIIYHFFIRLYVIFCDCFFFNLLTFNVNFFIFEVNKNINDSFDVNNGMKTKGKLNCFYQRTYKYTFHSVFMNIFHGIHIL